MLADEFDIQRLYDKTKRDLFIDEAQGEYLAAWSVISRKAF